MIQSAIFTQALLDCRDKAIVGGKAANLGRLARAGFQVPDGFVVTTRAYRFSQKQLDLPTGVPGEMPAEVAQEIRLAYRAMGEGSVAVRSSATAEDMAAASMAGQYETFLDIEGEEHLLNAVLRCWASLDSPRIRTYLREHAIDPSRVAMAVVVQRLVTADVAGVLFTANPQTGTRREMLVEASWGLGESVVSGRVQPDVLRLEQETGRVLAATIADKQVHLSAGVREERPVEESRRRMPCMGGRDVHRLWQLGRRAAEHFGAPQDIEWAIHGGELYVLQSRPITTLEEAEAYEAVLRDTRQHLRQELAAGRGPWAVHNLGETLPHPTPLTWSVIERFMSGAGGFGAMYRQVGFEPSPVAEREGFLERIAGRVYMDASRAPEMFFENFPFAYDLEELKRSPDASQTPPTLPRGSFTEKMKAANKLGAVNATLQELSGSLDRRLNDEIFPACARWVAEEKQCDVRGLSPAQLIELWQQREKHVLDEFAPQSLMPSLISGMALAELRTFVEVHFWHEDPEALSQFISSGGLPNRTVIADSELYEFASGDRSLDNWLAAHGHRAAGEFDLAAPRWREQPAFVHEMAARLAMGEGPLSRHRKHGQEVDKRIAELRAELSARDGAELDRLVDRVRRYVAFREDGKDFLMLGYDLLRDLALEAGRRLDIGDDVFFLTREDLFDSIRVGFAPHHLIEQRTKAYRAEIRLVLPGVIDSKAIDTLGEPVEIKTAGGYRAFAVSNGMAAGPARILRSPTEAGDLGRGYILVCPSTDPSWTPLFVNAAGLVLECGGTLSHGAVVAREMGLPAVVLPDATRLFADAEEIQVDGRRGWVGRAAEQDMSAPAELAEDPQDVRVPHELIPPPPGRKDQLAAKIRNICAIVWGVYLLAVFLLPDRWVYQPSLTVIDWLLWPMARDWGKPAVVAIVSAGLAALTLFVQLLVTDNPRLLEAENRAAVLKEKAAALPAGSPRRAAFERVAAPVQWRTLMAAMASVGILLGPMVMTFVWFTERVDPAKWNAAPGSPAQVVALVDGDFKQPVNLSVSAPLELDAATPAARSLPRIRRKLEQLLSLYTQPAADPAAPPELRAAPDFARELAAADLRRYLAAPIPPQGITWQVRSPSPNLRGRFPVTLTAGQGPPVVVNVVLGEKYPPAPLVAEGAGRSPVRELKVVYPRQAQEPVFMRPFSSLARFENNRLAARLAAVQIGWLALYVAAYLPVLLLLRMVLRVA